MGTRGSIAPTFDPGRRRSGHGALLPAAKTSDSLADSVASFSAFLDPNRRNATAVRQPSRMRHRATVAASSPFDNQKKSSGEPPVQRGDGTPVRLDATRSDSMPVLWALLGRMAVGGRGFFGGGGRRASVRFRDAARRVGRHVIVGGALARNRWRLTVESTGHERLLLRRGGPEQPRFGAGGSKTIAAGARLSTGVPMS